MQDKEAALDDLKVKVQYWSFTLLGFDYPSEKKFTGLQLIGSVVLVSCVPQTNWVNHTYTHIHSFLDFFPMQASTVEKAMAPHSSPLAWKIPWTEEPGRLQSMGSLRVGHDWVTSLSLFTFMHWRRKWQPTLVFLPGESQGQGSLVGCRLWGRKESDMTEQLIWSDCLLNKSNLKSKILLSYLFCESFFNMSLLKGNTGTHKIMSSIALAKKK